MADENKSSRKELSDHGPPGATEQSAQNTSKAEAPKAPSKAKKDTDIGTRFTAWSTSVETGRKLVLNLFIVAAIIIGIAVVAKATVMTSIIIQPISVPEEISKRGYAAEAVAHQIADELVSVVRNQDTSRQLGSFSTSSIETTLPKIDLPDSGITISAVVCFLVLSARRL